MACSLNPSSKYKKLILKNNKQIQIGNDNKNNEHVT